MLEDAFVTRDGEALGDLFEEGALLVAAGRRQQARGGQAIVQYAGAMWRADRTYIAEPRRILQAGETALVVAERAINVVRRGRDGAWRYTISLLSFERDPKEEQ